jgi:hypothetical protein
MELPALIADDYTVFALSLRPHLPVASALAIGP